MPENPAVMRAVERCPYRMCRPGNELAECTIDRRANDFVRIDTCVRCVKARSPELINMAVEPKELPVLDENAHLLPSIPVIQKWVGDAVYADSGMDGRFVGCKAFLVCGGPSLSEIDVSRMHRTGALVFAVNNAGAYPGVRPHFWTCVDEPKSFHQNIWLDPAICKLVPMTRAGRELRKKKDGKFSPLGRLAHECPNTLFYERNVHFQSRMFLPEPTVNWGCDPRVRCSEGIEGCRSVLLAAFKLIAVLGIKQVYLVGADFKMSQDRPYAFPQRKDPIYGEDGSPKSDPIGSNNRSYRVLSARLLSLLPYFSRSGISVLNATEGSELDVFSRLTYDDAILQASEGIESDPDLSEWYG